VISKLTGVESAYEIPDVLWDKIVPLLPPHKRKKKKKAGRPRMNDRKAINEHRNNDSICSSGDS